MNIIVFGATGGTGREFVRQALEKDHFVTSFVRDVSRLNMSHSHLRVVQGNALDREAVIQAIAGHDTAVSCLGAKQGSRPSAVLTEMARNLIAGMNQHSVRRILYMASADIYGELPGIGGRLTRFSCAMSSWIIVGLRTCWRKVGWIGRWPGLSGW